VTHEERFERIDQRLETITMNLEIVAGMQLTNEKAIEANTRAIEANERAIATLTEHTIQAMDAINRLANIAEAHQQRIEDLEHGKQ
jgi:hypothetical protein